MESRVLKFAAASLAAVFFSAAAPAFAGEPETNADGEMERRNRNALLGGGLLVGWYGATHWWKDGLTGNFRTAGEGWFGPDTYAGGADKMGHLFIGYAGTRLMARGFESLGNSPDEALWLGAATAFGTLLAIETVDGFSTKWRFSPEDLIMNAAGAGLGIFLERSPQLDRLLDFRMMYRPSRTGGSGFDPVGDYSGQTYLLVAKAAGVSAMNQSAPLRYLELAVGYGSRGYGDMPAAQRDRRIYVGVSLNLSGILDDTLFRQDRNSSAARATRMALEFFQVPGTAAALSTHSF
ncbi:MAG TPA: DUF2279 domain-containing protein [Gallionella sp.]|nr:DUF2279 domain-containing protein [Gallionella sp.]